MVSSVGPDQQTTVDMSDTEEYENKNGTKSSPETTVQQTTQALVSVPIIPTRISAPN